MRRHRASARRQHAGREWAGAPPPARLRSHPAPSGLLRWAARALLSGAYEIGGSRLSPLDSYSSMTASAAESGTPGNFRGKPQRLPNSVGSQTTNGNSSRSQHGDTYGVRGRRDGPNHAHPLNSALRHPASCQLAPPTSPPTSLAAPSRPSAAEIRHVPRPLRSVTSLDRWDSGLSRPSSAASPRPRPLLGHVPRPLLRHVPRPLPRHVPGRHGT